MVRNSQRHHASYTYQQNLRCSQAILFSRGRERKIPPLNDVFPLPSSRHKRSRPPLECIPDKTGRGRTLSEQQDMAGPHHGDITLLCVVIVVTITGCDTSSQ
ncbi:uncharacterized protein LOC143025354 isoform X2 [Oratosquilla oratoria]|uniref:uncharacterized protein LOC143025354 isoform X2 n=1 Tax=Oratosquilla oratoria TaxID=337810 RepID=UPI003F775599